MLELLIKTRQSNHLVVRSHERTKKKELENEMNWEKILEKEKEKRQLEGAIKRN